MDAEIGDDRAYHWIKPNHQTRLPNRWISFDSEARSEYCGDVETQYWRMGAAIRWREDLKTGDHAEACTFDCALDLWEWVTDFCKPRQRTAMFAHNLGYDVRVTEALDVLPKLGWRLEWCNLDRNVSAMTWRSDNGTLVLWDTWTWLPLPLNTIAPSVGLRKLNMPPDTAKHWRWEKYCMRDAEIGYRVVKELIAYLRENQLGNWQPTGAGMAYATWRHKFLTHKVLVHADREVITAERKAMHTGRAEAWRHGLVKGDTWTEVDLRNAYVTIAAECDLPTKVKFKTGAMSLAQFHNLTRSYRVLAFCDISTLAPVVPYHTGTRTIWPVGAFASWLWDTEVDRLSRAGSTVRIRAAIAYTRKPILAEWAQWALSVIRSDNEDTSPVVRTWVKHCSRALIGRISLRVTKWELFGSNPFGMTAITHVTDAVSGVTRRHMHIGDRTFEESGRTEGRDSLPQVTGWIMAECRARLWDAMCTAGLDEIAHVDTDSLVVSSTGLQRLREAYGARFGEVWAVKGSARRLVVYGPRNYRFGRERKASGVPRKATELLPNHFRGERWQGFSTALEAGLSSSVQVVAGTWTLDANDPRRADAPGGRTRAIEV